MTSEEVFNVIRDLIEVSEISRNTNPKYPQYVKYFVESGDKKSLDYLSYSITVIENHLDNLKKICKRYKLSIERKQIYI